jgi:hypothetical protein
VSVEEEPLWVEARAAPSHPSPWREFEEDGLKQCKTGPSIFMSEEMIVGCYVDDLLVTSSEAMVLILISPSYATLMPRGQPVAKLDECTKSILYFTMES